MNFLAHIYLSGDNDLIKIGNFMADGIRGKQYENYPLEIQKGIILHRAIDTFTDAHPIFRQSTKRLHNNYHHYAGVIVDILYDHFLAKNWNKYSDEKLEDFVDEDTGETVSIERNEILFERGDFVQGEHGAFEGFAVGAPIRSEGDQHGFIAQTFFKEGLSERFPLDFVAANFVPLPKSARRQHDD